MKIYCGMIIEYKGKEYAVISGNLEENLLCIGYEEGSLGDWIRYENCKVVK